jgi:hypothetical protein
LGKLDVPRAGHGAEKPSHEPIIPGERPFVNGNVFDTKKMIPSLSTSATTTV